VAPELGVVMAYTKVYLNARLLDSDLPEDPYLSHDLERYFPPPLAERFGAQMRDHRLRREIIATVVANQLVDRAGTTFAFRLREETGAPSSILARGYAVAREVFEMRKLWAAIEDLDGQVEAQVQLAMLIDARKLVERATRRLVRTNPVRIDIAATIAQFEPGAQLLADGLPELLEGVDSETFECCVAELTASGVPDELATRVASFPSLLAVFDVVEGALATERELEVVVAVHFGFGSRLELNWLRDRIIELPRSNRWQVLAREALRDDLYRLHSALTQEVLETGGPDADGPAAIDAWCEHNRAGTERTLAMLADIRASRTYDTTTLAVALQEVRNLLRRAQSAARLDGTTL
jgi:glutamate dehydrogenase